MRLVVPTAADGRGGGLSRARTLSVCVESPSPLWAPISLALPCPVLSRRVSWPRPAEHPLPPPSRPPHSYIYTAGMLVAAVSIFGVVALFTQFLMSRVERELQTTVKASLLMGSGATLSLAVHAFVRTKELVFQLLADNEDIFNNNELGLETTVHDSSAGLFLLFACMYITLTLYMLKYSPRLLAFHSRAWWRFKALCMFVPALSMVLAAGYMLNTADARARVNAKGLTEVVCMG
jgi:hypothetical protein